MKGYCFTAVVVTVLTLVAASAVADAIKDVFQPVNAALAQINAAHN
jgi:branched-subunit amino acid permease